MTEVIESRLQPSRLDTQVRVFSINDYEWWAGAGTPQDILAHYMESTGVSHEDATGDPDEYPEPLSDEAMERCVFTVDDTGMLLDTPLSFRDKLTQMIEAGETFPTLFACTID